MTALAITTGNGGGNVTRFNKCGKETRSKKTTDAIDMYMGVAYDAHYWEYDFLSKKIPEVMHYIVETQKVVNSLSSR